MKKINRGFIKGTNWALAGLLALIGFSSCDSVGKEMYGVPWKGYAIKGTVVDKATGKPIPGIEVKVSASDEIKASYPEAGSWVEKTDANGNFEIQDTPNDPVTLISRDVDGATNNAFQPDTIQVDYKDAEHIGGGKGWSQGYLTTTVRVEMEEEKKD